MMYYLPTLSSFSFMNNSRYNEKNGFFFHRNDAIVIIIRLIMITITQMIFYYGNGVGSVNYSTEVDIYRYDTYTRHNFQTNNKLNTYNYTVNYSIK